MQRKAKLVRRTPPKRRSKKQAARLRAYKPIRDKFLSEKDTCAVMMPNGARLTGCRIFATQVHHPEGRMGDLLTDESLFIPTCDGPCHLWLETHPEEAIKLGLSLKRLNHP